MKNKVKKVLTHVVLLLASCFFIIPFVWLLSTSLKPPTQIFTWPPEWIPKPFTWSNYIDAVAYIPFFTYLKNTVVITVLSTVGAMLSCPLVAYSFAKLRWKGRNVLFAITNRGDDDSHQVTMIPLFIMFEKVRLGWDTVTFDRPGIFRYPAVYFLIEAVFSRTSWRTPRFCEN